MKRHTLFIIVLLIGFSFFAGHYFNDSLAIENDYIFLKEVGQRFADNQNYTLDYHDCKHYSREYNFVLKSLGFESYMMYNEEENHMYNLIGIEPQNNLIRKTKDNIKFG